MDIDKIKSKVKKLLALSASPNENEAAAAIEKAQRLMDEYNLSKSQCLYGTHSVPATKRLSNWRMVLSNAVAWLYCCETYRTLKGERIFFGESFEAFMAAEMYRYLSKTIERIAKQNIRKNAKRPYREKYKLGIASRLATRIREMGALASWAPTREHRSLAVKTALDAETTVETKTVKMAGTGSDAFRRGASAGNAVSINRQTTGHGGRYIEAR